MANRSSGYKNKITMSKGDLLKDFMVETFEDAFSELEKEFGALNRVSLRGH
jgi:hypothetical protein